MEIFTKNSAKCTVFQSTICNKFSSLMCPPLGYSSEGLSTFLSYSVDDRMLLLDSSHNKPCISPLHWWLYIIHCVLVSKRRVSRGISNSNGGKEWNYMIAYSFHQWTEGKKICSTHNLFYHSGACATSDTWKGLVFIRTFRSSTIPGSISSTYRVTFGFFYHDFALIHTSAD
jgi:hypothetical protein